mgnify:CR=1 FL=1
MAANRQSFFCLVDAIFRRQRRALLKKLMHKYFAGASDEVAKSRAKHLAFRERPWRDVLAVEFYEMNSDFHEGLARCSGNRFMLAAVQQQIQLRRFLNYNWEYGVERVQESITEHLEILDALDAGHNERASALMRNHLTTSAHHGVMNPDHAKPR